MGRILSGGGGAGSVPRRQIITLTASNPTLAIPSWAQGGKGILKITGCGGGGGGGGANGSFNGGDAASAAHSADWPILIPNGKTTVNAVVGAPGTGGAIGTNGGAGGNSEVSFNGDTHPRIRLTGGFGGGGSNGSTDGVSTGADAFPAIGSGSSNPTTLGFVSGSQSQAGETAVRNSVWNLTKFPFASGSPASRSTNTGAAIWRATPYGFGEIGYGGGGNGGTGTNEPGFNGGPGLLILEFVEGL